MDHCRGQAHQWDSSHSEYSDNVIKFLGKLAELLSSGITACDDCKKKNAKDGKANPPYRLVARFNLMSKRLSGLLRGGADSWRSPIFVSKYAYEYALEKQGPYNK